MVNIAGLEKEQQDVLSKERGLTLPSIGDGVSVVIEISEGDKSRQQRFDGRVIAIHNGGPRSTFTVRKESHGVGVERIFPLYSPALQSITVKSHHKIRRSKLYYLRELRGKKARLKLIHNKK